MRSSVPIAGCHAMSDTVVWAIDPHVMQTIAEDSFGGWEAALTEAVKNSIDADAKTIGITLPAKEIMVPPVEQVVVIEDDGHGMTRKELASEY